MKKFWLYLLTLVVVAYMMRLFAYDQRDIRIHCCCCTCDAEREKSNQNNENSGNNNENNGGYLKNESENGNGNGTAPYITDTPDYNYNDNYDITEPTENPFNQYEQQTAEPPADPYNPDAWVTNGTETPTPTDPAISDITEPPENNGTPPTGIRGPYTTEEIKFIFTSERAAFEMIKTIFVNTDYTADIYAIDAAGGGKEIYYKDSATENYVGIDQIYNHEIITELFSKYNIFSINSYSWENHAMQKRETGIIFQMILTDSYEQWILYSETHEFYESDASDGSQSGETIRLDNNWYYMYVKY